HVTEQTPEVAPYLPLVVMKRLEHPWEALRLPLSITHQSQETFIANTEMGLVGEVLFSAIEAHAASILAARPHQFNADSLVGNVEGFTALSGGVAKEVEM